MNNSQTFFSIAYSGTVDKVEYFFDGQSIGSSLSAPFQISWTPKDIGGGNHTVTAVASSNGNQTKLDKGAFFQLRLGDDFQGGKIFFINTDGVTGLIASTTDMAYNGNKLFFWGQRTQLNTNGDGAGNTKKMASLAQETSDAGYLFKNGYNYNGYTDWYIPTTSELNTLKQNQQYVGNLSNVTKDSYYWSSNELSANEAYGLCFAALSGTNYVKTGWNFHIRSIRKF